MKTFTSVKEIQTMLDELVTAPEVTKAVYSLDVMRNLMKALGNPQDSYKSVHIAGTSGKTSTSYYIAALLKAGGYKVGLTVSPHITDIRERSQINGSVLSENEYCKYFTKYYSLLAESGIKTTYFETLVAFSFWLFAELKVDFAVVEVGLGGTLDCTNVINRNDKIAVITDIGFDHVHILGNTIQSIANNKAGIIQQGNAVYCHLQSDEIMREIHNRASRVGATCTVIQFADAQPYAIDTSFLPAFQRRNWQLAAVVAKAIFDQASTNLTPEMVSTVVRAVAVPGRMEIFNIRDKTIILDGAHNPQKLTALFESIHERFNGQQIGLLFAMAKADDDKLHQSVLIIASNANTIIVTEFLISQDLRRHSVEAERVRDAIIEKRVTIQRDARKAVNELLALPESVLVITGSLFLVGVIRPLLFELATDQ